MLRKRPFAARGRRTGFNGPPDPASALHDALHQPLEEQPLGEGEGDDAGGDHDDVDCGDARPGPLAHAALGCGQDHRHGARRLVVGQGRAQQILAPGGDEIDDEHHHQPISRQWQAHHPERLPDAGAVDPGRFHQFARNQLENAAHDQHADREIERDVGKDQAAGAVDQIEETLDLVDRDDRDDAGRKVEGGEEHRHDEGGAARFQMNQGIARQHRAGGGDQHRRPGHVDAVEQVDRQSVDLLEHIAVVGEIERSRPELAAHRIGQRLDRQQQHPKERQDDGEHEDIDHAMADDHGAVELPPSRRDVDDFPAARLDLHRSVLPHSLRAHSLGRKM